jgi:hypothetical protein
MKTTSNKEQSGVLPSDWEHDFRFTSPVFESNERFRSSLSFLETEVSKALEKLAVA